MASDPLGPKRPVENATAAAAALVDRAAAAPVVAIGSLPPDARDLDLLVHPQDEAAITCALRGGGFVAEGEHWARFAECTASEVELLPAERLGLAAHELEALFTESAPLPGFEHLSAPAPHHRILLGATRLLGRSGYLAPRHRERLARIVDEHPEAWAEAEARAAGWGAQARLPRLARALAGEPPPPHTRVLPLLRRVRATLRPCVVALSGIDGSGKSLQARALAETLERLGRPAAVTWAPLANEAWLDRLIRAVKRVPRLVPLTRRREVVVDPGPREAPSTPEPVPAQRSPVLIWGWATIVSLVNAWSLGRDILRHAWAGRVVVADRYRLDSAVRMRFFYDEESDFRAQRLLVAALSPTPRHAFFLDVDPATSLARKDDVWSQEQLGVQTRLYHEERDRFAAERLDGERPPAELCSEIAERVWRGLMQASAR